MKTQDASVVIGSKYTPTGHLIELVYDRRDWDEGRHWLLLRDGQVEDARARLGLDEAGATVRGLVRLVVKCGRDHGGNHELAELTSGGRVLGYECAGCGQSYTVEHVATASTRRNRRQK